MAPSSMIAATFIAAISTVIALPQKVDTSMPVLSSVIATAAGQQSSQAQQWWTPSASQSEWDWRAWSSTQAQSAPTAVVSVATPAALEITSQTSVAYSNPFTVYTSMTDSRGVITGMPAVATSQPTQAAVASVCSGCASVLSAESSWSSMVASIYSTSTPVAVSSNTALSTSTRGSSTGSASASGTGFSQSQSTGAASKNTVLSSGAALAIFGVVAALL